MDDYSVLAENWNYAESQIVGSERRLEHVKNRLSDSLDEARDRDDMSTRFNLENILSDCQICIETSVKAMFKLMNVEHPRTHGLNFDDQRVQGFVRSIPDDFDGKRDIPRAVFLTKFWEQYYSETKYGVPELNLTPGNLFTVEDAHRAAEDAEFCIMLGLSLLDYMNEVLHEMGEETTRK